ncbi:MAG TPA: hypothetical protein VK272_04535 [Solirubrobacteraceae bacterium]|nr:hypothetical protein [Solirubrobacteraceae bacterium]
MRRGSTRVKVALVVGLALWGVAGGLTLLQSPIGVLRSNTRASAFIDQASHTLSACQAGEALPAETSAVRLRVETLLGPRVAVGLFARGRAIARGERGPGWTGGAVTVPVSRLASARTGVTLCFSVFLNGHETAVLNGERTPPAFAARTGGEPLPGRLRVEYLRPSGSSWWSLLPDVARRMGLGRAWAGIWSALLAAVSMCGVVLVCSRLILGELR